MDTDEPFVKRLDKVYKAVCPRLRSLSGDS